MSVDVGAAETPWPTTQTQLAVGSELKVRSGVRSSHVRPGLSASRNAGFMSVVMVGRGVRVGERLCGATFLARPVSCAACVRLISPPSFHSPRLNFLLGRCLVLFGAPSPAAPPSLLPPPPRLHSLRSAHAHVPRREFGLSAHALRIGVGAQCALVSACVAHWRRCTVCMRRRACARSVTRSAAPRLSASLLRLLLMWPGWPVTHRRAPTSLRRHAGEGA